MGANGNGAGAATVAVAQEFEISSGHPGRDDAPLILSVTVGAPDLDEPGVVRGDKGDVADCADRPYDARLPPGASVGRGARDADAGVAGATGRGDNQGLTLLRLVHVFLDDSRPLVRGEPALDDAVGFSVERRDGEECEGEQGEF